MELDAVSIPSSGNVFADLGIEDPEAALVKSNLVLTLTRVLRQRRLSEATSASILGLSEEEMRSILRGNFLELTEDYLRSLVMRAREEQDHERKRPYKRRGWHLLLIKKSRDRLVLARDVVQRTLK